MNRYLIRAAKYAVELVVLFLAIFILMNLFSQSKLSLNVFLEQRGLLMIVAVVVFALLYPFFGFTKKTLTFNATEKVENVENIMKMCGFVRISGDDNAMVFKAESAIKKLAMLYEDTIQINTIDGVSVMEGVRKEVVKAYFRMGTYIG